MNVGYQSSGKFLIEPLFDQYKHLFKICHIVDKFVFTHAGISDKWFQNVYGETYNEDNYEYSLDVMINDILTYQPYKLYYSDLDYSRFGNNIHQTPIWIRPESLIKANRNTYINSNYIQIFGHIIINKIDYQGKSTGGKYYNVDCLNGSTPQYIIINNNIVEHKKIKI